MMEQDPEWVVQYVRWNDRRKMMMSAICWQCGIPLLTLSLHNEGKAVCKGCWNGKAPPDTPAIRLEVSTKEMKEICQMEGIDLAQSLNARENVIGKGEDTM